MSLTSTRKNVDRGINMPCVTEVQHIVILAEHKLLDYRDVRAFCADRSPALSALAAGADGGSFLRLFLQTE